MSSLSRIFFCYYIHIWYTMETFLYSNRNIFYVCYYFVIISAIEDINRMFYTYWLWQKRSEYTGINSYSGHLKTLNLRHYVWKNRKTRINSCPDRGRFYIIGGGEKLEYGNKARNCPWERFSLLPATLWWLCYIPEERINILNSLVWWAD